MARIKIQDLAADMEISAEQMRKVMGGVEPTTFPVIPFGSLPAFNAGSLLRGIKGVNIQDVNPVNYFPGHVWREK
jgi:hypothetical protein